MKKLSLLFLVLIMSCTEEISNEVKESSSSDNKTQSEVEKFKNKAIRLVHKMDEDLSHIMHKSGNAEEDCELKAPTLGFSAGDYSKTDSSYAIDCILDVEELDLYFNGAEIELQVDENLCEYIEYQPYSFINDMIGRSFNRYFVVTCDETCDDNGPPQFDSICGKIFDSYNGSLTSFDPTSEDFADPLGSEEDACYFNHTSRKCDLGYSQAVRIEFSGSQDLDGDGEVDTELDGDGEEVPIEPVCNLTSANHYNMDSTVEQLSSCGGTVSACLGGPGADSVLTEEDEDDEDFKDARVKSTIFVNDDLSEFTESFTYTSPFSKGASTNMYIANYSRMCANTSNPKTDYENFSTTNLKGAEVELMNTDTFEDGQFQDSFIYTFDDFTVGDNGDDHLGWYGIIRDSQDSDIITGIQWAHHPFHGAIGAQPFYSFKCLDKARDTKAHIRLFIREWDREFADTNTYLNYSSDYNSSSTRYMDLYLDAQDGTERWNDFLDWDDFFQAANVFNNNSNQCTLSDYSDTYNDVEDTVGQDKLFNPDREVHSRNSFPKLNNVN